MELPPRPGGGRPNGERPDVDADDADKSIGDGLDVAGEVERACWPPSCGKLLSERSDREFDIMNYVFFLGGVEISCPDFRANRMQLSRRRWSVWKDQFESRCLVNQLKR